MSSNPDVPPFTGYVETTVNALRLIHAARQGLIPRITRRLNDSERRSMIKSGAVFVFSVEESGIKRWTDGLLWSPSRIVGNFLVYREINERSSSRSAHKKSYPSEDSPTRILARKTSPDQLGVGYKAHGGAEQGTFKVGGLIKKTITVTIDGSDLHLISYYTSEDIRSGKLKRPSSRPDIMSLYMAPHIFRLTNFRVPPKVEIAPDGKARLVENDESDSPVDCKVEDHGNYSLPASPTWGQHTASSLQERYNPDRYNTDIGVYNGRTGEARWLGHTTDHHVMASLRNEVNWSQSTGNLSSHRRREGSIAPDGWSVPNSTRQQWPVEARGQSYEPRTSPQVRTLVYGNHQMIGGARREPENQQPAFPLRYPNSARESAIQRLQWQSRDASVDSARDVHRSPQPSSASYSTSSSIGYSSQGHYPTSSVTYANTWTSSDTNGLVSTPNMQQSISPSSGLGYDGSYSSSGAASPGLSGAEDFASVDEGFRT